MSYILDALQRSEHERKQGELPSFRQDQSLLFMKKERKSPWLMLLVFVLLLNAMVFLYIHFSGPSDDVNQLVDQTSGLNVDAGGQSKGHSVTSVEAAGTLNGTREYLAPETKEHVLPASSGNMQKAASAESALVEPKLVSEKAVLPSLNPKEILKTQTTDPVKQTQTEQQPALEPLISGVELPAPAIEASNEEYELIEPKPLASNDAKTDDWASNPRVVVSDTPLDLQENKSVEEALDSDPYEHVLFLEELDQRTRPNVSRLTFNSHIYSSTPSARRVMINNIYLREGQAFQGMTLLSIGEQYVVFEKEGQQFKIAAMRDWMG